MPLRTILLGLILAAAAATAGAAIVDRKAGGSAWLDEEGAYPASAQGKRNTFIELANGPLLVSQDVYAHYDSMGALEVADSGGAMLFRLPLAIGGGNKGIPGGFGYYGKLGYRPDRKPTAESLMRSGGVYFWKPGTQEWILWSREKNRPCPFPDPVRDLEAVPWGTPDFGAAGAAERIRWKYATAGTDIVCELADRDPAVRVWLAPRVVGNAPIEISWESAPRPLLAVCAAGSPPVSADAAAGAPSAADLPLNRPVTVFLSNRQAGEERLALTVLAAGRWEKASLVPRLSRDGKAFAGMIVSGQQTGLEDRFYFAVGPVAASVRGLAALPLDPPPDFGMRIVHARSRRVFTTEETVGLAVETADPSLRGARGTIRLSDGDAVVAEKPLSLSGIPVPLSFPAAFLRPGNHTVTVSLAGRPETCRYDVHIVRPWPGQFFVRQMYGMGAGIGYLPWLRNHGFNAVYRYSTDPNFDRFVDLAPKYGVKVIASIPHTISHGNPEDCNNNPAALEKNRASFAAFVERYRGHPGLGMISSRSEVGDPFCTCAHCLKRLRDEVRMETFPAPDARRAFQPGVVEDDNPPVSYMHWWKTAGGIATLHKALAETVRKLAPGIPTLHDEGFLCLGHPWTGYARGYCRRLDILMKWTYADGEMRSVPFWTDMLLGACEPGQRVLANTQLLWKPGAVADVAYGLAPDIVREASWLTLMCGGGAMSHWGDFLVRDDPDRYIPQDSGDFKGLATWPETSRELAALGGTLFAPLGPLFTVLSRPRADVALFTSYTDEAFRAFAHHGPLSARYGDFLDLHVPVDILFEEDVEAGALSRYRVLTIDGIRYMRRSVRERIAAFARNGGLVVADPEFPVVLPHRKIPTGNLEALREDVLPVLKGRIAASCATPDVRLRPLENGGIMYLVIVNDRREFGPVLGKYRKMKEKGLPQEAVITVAARGAAVYDLTRGRRVAAEPVDGGLKLTVPLPPAGGRLLALYPQAIGRVGISAPGEVSTGAVLTLDVSVRGADGAPMAGAQPLKIERLDGPTVVETSWHAAVAGRYTARIPVPDAEPGGVRGYRVTELSSGMAAAAEIRVRPGPAKTAITLGKAP